MRANRNQFNFKVSILFLIFLFLTSCGGGSGGNTGNTGNSGGNGSGNGGGGVSDPIIQSISISPSSPVVQLNGLMQLTLMANFSDSTSLSVTSGISWTSSDLSIAAVSAGQISGIQTGQVTISASYAELSDSVVVTVSEGLSGDVVISEVGSGQASSGQWFEVYNSSGTDIELSNYSVRMMSSSNGTATYPLPAKTVPAGAYLVVMTKDIAAIYPASPGYAGNPNVVIMNTAGSWNQSGFLELIQNNITVDFMRFGNTGVQPLTAGEWGIGFAPSLVVNDYGLSLARDGNNADTNAASDWVLQQYPTMGGANDITCSDDTDEDGIPDCSELPGSTYAGLPLYDLGARVNQKDLFVEIDYMDPTLKQGQGEHVDGMIPQREALDKVVAKFAQHNIALHFDVGDIFDQATGTNPANYDLGGGNRVPFANSIFIGSGANADMYQYKAQNMAVNRRSIFYYVMLGYSQDGGSGSSGIAEIFGNDVLITIGAWGLSRNIAGNGFTATENTNRLINFQAATLMHEFGHALGLHHGGNSSDGENLKPNYFSTMNYLYQLQGLSTIGSNEGDRYYAENYPGGNCGNGSMTNPFWGSHTNFKIDYSNGSGADLEEVTGVTESQGLRRAGSTAVDFNCNGSSYNVLTNVNLNPHYSGSKTQLNDHDDWGNLQFFFASSQNKLVNGASQPRSGTSDTSEADTLPLMTNAAWSDRQPIIEEPIPDFEYMKRSHRQSKLNQRH